MKNDFNKIWDLIDYLLDCCEYPAPGEVADLPNIVDEDGNNEQDLRTYAKKELEKIINE